MVIIALEDVRANPVTHIVALADFERLPLLKILRILLRTANSAIRHRYRRSSLRVA